MTERIPGPRWRGLSLGAAAERLGVSPSVTARAADAGRLEARRRGSARYVTQAELRRFVATPAAWVAAHPRDIVDPDLRAHALAAWEACGSPALYPVSDLARRYAASPATVARWRERGWCAGAWHWHGSARHGAWWLVWAGDLPAAPPIPWPTAGRTQPTRRAVGEARRAAVIAAVERRGGPPGRGSRSGFWAAVAAEVGGAIPYVHRLWYEHARALREREERPHAHAAD